VSEKIIDIIYFLETDCFSSISPMPIKPFRFIHPSVFSCPYSPGFPGYAIVLSKSLNATNGVNMSLIPDFSYKKGVHGRERWGGVFVQVGSGPGEYRGKRYEKTILRGMFP
jgi:hypothetical protein